MKKIILPLTILLLMFTSCKESCLKKPKNLKSIDWENYNDVHTVFWNTYSYDNIGNSSLKKEIMVYGWIFHMKDAYYGDATDFILVNDYSDMYGYAPPVVNVEVRVFSSEVQALFDTCVLTKKCFVKGELLFNKLKMGRCTRLNPRIIIRDINDIYFE